MSMAEHIKVYTDIGLWYTVYMEGADTCHIIDLNFCHKTSNTPVASRTL